MTVLRSPLVRKDCILGPQGPDPTQKMGCFRACQALLKFLFVMQGHHGGVDVSAI